MTTATAPTLTEILTMMTLLADEHELTLKHDAARGTHRMLAHQGELEIFADGEGGYAWRMWETRDGYRGNEQSSGLDSLDELQALIEELGAMNVGPD